MRMSRLHLTGGRLAVLWSVLAIFLCAAASIATAQEEQPTPKWDLFAGYSWADPGAKLHAISNGTPLNNAFGAQLNSDTRGFGTALTRNFNKWFGVTGDFAAHFSGSGDGFPRSADASLYTLSLGPKFTMRGEHLSPFIEALVGWNRLSPDGFDNDDRVGFMTGGGLDWAFTRHWGWRVIQADWIAANHHFGPSSVVPTTHESGARLQSGLLWFMGGGPPPAPAAASCSVNPNEVMAGEPVKATATASNFPKDRKLTYTWSSTGGKVSGNDENASVDTTGLAAGSYTVTSKVSDGKKANAECTSNFSVKEPPKNPPTVSCSADPATVKSGEPSTITCTCTSPDNRQVSLSNWTASAGKVTGNGNTGTLDTAGAPAGAINISATCSDDRGLTAQGSTSVNVEQPPPPPTASKLNEITFKKNNARVDNAAKAVLDQVADRLQQDPTSKAAIIGEVAPGERGKNLAAQRAVNAKAYLTSGENQKAIDPSRISVYTGGDGGMRDEIYVIPEGATFNVPNTTPVDESKIKPTASHPRAAAKKGTKKAAKKPAA
jgi:outer membrane protein OmpA-like peptidoglycan-associated protein